MYSLKKGAAIATLALAAANASHANDIRINGFASIVAGQTVNAEERDGLQARYIADEPSGSTYTDELSFKPDSLYGLQITADLSDGLSVVGQIIGTGGNDFDAGMSWGYIKYEFNDNWSVLGGRQRLPLYFYSDVLDVGYSYHWLRPPTEGSLASDTLDGAQVRFDSQIGDWDARLQFFTGTSDSESVVTGTAINYQDIYGLVASASNDWLQLRASYMEAALSASLNGTQIFEPIDNTFYSFSAQVNVGNSFLVSEFTFNELDTPYPGFDVDKIEAGYVSVGHNLGSITPHVTYSFQSNRAFDIPGFSDGTISENTITVGTRWDFHPKAALKVEYLTLTDENAEERFANLGGNPATSSSAVVETDLFSVGVDVIF